MKSIVSRIAGYVTATSLTATLALFSISPSFASGLLSSKNGSETQIQIQSHKVDVTIEDGYAITSIEQEFFNTTTQDIEAIYEFPVPDNGTVAEFTVWIDEQPVIGEVVEKEKAKQLYEQEKAAGREAGLTEKKNFYRFETSVSPVRSQQTTRTRLVYLQPADIEGGVGRYVYPLEEGGTDQAKQEFWNTNTEVKGVFKFDLNLRSGYPVDAVRVPRQPQANVSTIDKHQWQINIDQIGQANTPVNTVSSSSDEDTTRTRVFSDLSSLEADAVQRLNSSSFLNEDIVVYWRLAPNLPGSIDLVAHREPGERRGTFMLTVSPGVDLAPITEGRDWIFLLDKSGSMQGKYASLLDAASQSLQKLNTNDRFKIILFNKSAQDLMSDWTVVSQQNIQSAIAMLNQTRSDGGTNLYAGLQSAINKLDQDRTSAIILITDGVANVGRTQREDFLKLMQSHDVRLFTAVMGNGSNRPLLTEMSKVSKGFATSVSNSDDIMGVLMGATEKVTHEALHDVKLKIKGIKTADLTPSTPATLYKGEQLVIFGHYYGDNEAEVTLKAKISGQETEFKTRFYFPESSTTNPEVERLWAYEYIQQLKQQSDYIGTDLNDHRSAIVDVATEYGLVTDFTSMIVMRDEQFQQNGIDRSNKKRRDLETASASKRKTVTLKTNRADGNTPAFQNNRASYSGGGGSGSFNPTSVLILLPLLISLVRRRTNQ